MKENKDEKICKNCFEEPALQNDNLCKNCYDAITNDGYENLDKLIDSMN